MNIWDLFKKYDCINIKIDSIEEMKEMLKLAKENNFEKYKLLLLLLQYILLTSPSILFLKNGHTVSISFSISESLLSKSYFNCI